jgi:alkanesulfonate monooxygenase SsuD/methylene tetrahydromethanopterin reductase-like flavin-dependent oxidoreductase (luciferase family)
VLAHEGEFFAIKEALMVVPPVQRPRPPLWYGVGSIERAQWAAREGINIIALRPPEVVRTFTDAFCEEWDQARPTDRATAAARRRPTAGDRPGRR